MLTMPRQPKPPKNPSLIKPLFAQNVASLLDYHYPVPQKFPNPTARAVALGKKYDIGKNTILRAADPSDETALTMDNIEILSKMLGVFPYQLLIPYLDAKNPQVAYTPTEAEKRLYAKFKAPQPKK